MSDCLDPANLEILKEQIRRRRTGERQPYEITWTRLDGTTVTTSISPVPLPPYHFQSSKKENTP